MRDPRHLTCACCGEAAWNRQWWNQDKGFGLCTRCIPFVLAHGCDEAQLERSYGKRGVHIDLPDPSATPDVDPPQAPEPAQPASEPGPAEQGRQPGSEPKG